MRSQIIKLMFFIITVGSFFASVQIFVGVVAADDYTEGSLEDEYYYTFEEEEENPILNVTSGKNVNLTCLQQDNMSQIAVQWFAKAVKVEYQRDDYQIQRKQLDEQLKLGKNEIFLKSVSYACTGYIYCTGVDRKVIREYYLYVKDENVLSLGTTRTFSADIVTDENFYRIYVPCWSATPDVHVDLFLGKSFDPKVQHKIASTNGSGCHMIEHGFMLDSDLCGPQLSVGVIIYTCKFSRSSKKESLTSRIIITPRKPTVPKPSLSKVDITNKNVIGGRLLLRCSLKANKTISIKWLTPQTDNEDHHIQNLTKRNNLTNEIVSFLTINNLSASDEGRYYCMAEHKKDDFNINYIKISLHRTKNLTIIIHEAYIDLISSTKKGISVTWPVTFNNYHYSEYYMYWLKNGNPFPDAQYSPKVFMQFTLFNAFLRIINVSETDFANYTLVAKNGEVSKKFDIRFDELKSHEIRIEVVDVEKGLVKCISAAFPKTSIQWYFIPYPLYKRYLRLQVDDSYRLHESYSVKNGLQVTSYINLNSTITGKLKCVAVNAVAKDVAIQDVLGLDNLDLKVLFELPGIIKTVSFDTDDNMKTDVDLGTQLTLICVVSAYNYSGDIVWSHNNHTHPFNSIIQKTVNLMYFYIIAVRISIKEKNWEGTYRCEASSKDNIKYSRTIEITVGDEYFQPNISSTNMNNDQTILLHNRFELYCNSTGYPTPRISWLKDNKSVGATDKIKFLNYNQTLVFVNFTEEDVGSYRCEAINSEGKDFKEINLTFRLLSSENFKNHYVGFFWVIIFALILVLVLISVFTIIKVQKEKQLRRQLKRLGLDNFEKGDLEKLDPELKLDEQADFLPYDRKWEIPIENIELGKKLGSGAFGLVLQGTMKDADGNRTQVAVKMVKKKTDLSALKALATELKIMVYLGKHPNIVNLLGACTKNITKRELLVIVEYCPFGNLQSYLLENKLNFVNQVDFKTCQIDYSIRRRNQKGEPSISKNGSKSKLHQMKYSTLLSEANRTESEFNENLQNDSILNFDGEENYSTKIYTEDLLAWCYQVVQGMEYLSSRKVLHGDLAARNVLLTENKIVKICDFGLSKKTYHYDFYQKKGQVPLPVKWLAPESIIDRLFSTQSDVWSFGVLLWEIFSLGSTPYPTMAVDETFYKKIILDGYRMEKPEFAPTELYRIMLACWKMDPLMRPLFSDLVERIGRILEGSVENCGLDMNRYKLMNNHAHDDESQDCLEMKTSHLENDMLSNCNYNKLPSLEEIPPYHGAEAGSSQISNPIENNLQDTKL